MCKFFLKGRKWMAFWVLALTITGNSFGKDHESTETHSEALAAKTIKKNPKKYVIPNIDVKEIQLPQLTVPIWFVKTEQQTVTLDIVFRNEGARNFRNQPGLLSICKALLQFGAGPYDGPQYARMCTENGIQMNFRITNDDVEVYLYTTVDKFSLGMELMKLAAVDAKLPKKEMSRLKKNLRRDYKQDSVCPESKALEKLRDILFPRDHPYNLYNQEFVENIGKYTYGDVKEVYKKMLDPKDAVVVVAGNISEDEVVKECEKFFGALAKVKHCPFPKKVEQKTELFQPGTVIHLTSDLPQTFIVFAHPGIEKSSPDYDAFGLANWIFGEGASSVLFKKLRESLGLVYDINSGVITQDLFCWIQGEARTAANNRDRFIAQFKKTFEQFIQKGITPQEWEKRKEMTSLSIDLSTGPKIVNFLQSRRYRCTSVKQIVNAFERGYSLTASDVNRVIKKFFSVDKLVFVTTGKEVGEQK